MINDDGRNFYQPAANIVAAFDAADVDAADVDAADVAAVVVAVAQLSEQWLPSAQPRCVPAASPRRTRPRQSPAAARGRQTFPVAASIETLPVACRVGGRLKIATSEDFTCIEWTV